MNNKIVILTGGESSRFYPFNRVHKSLFTIAGQSVLQRTLGNIIERFDTEIIIVLGSKNFEIERKMIEDCKLSDKLTFVKQDKPLGMSDALISAKKYLKSNFFVVNSQQADFCDFTESFVKKLESNDSLAVVGFQQTKEPWKYGILDFDGEKPLGLVEKPEKGSEPSNKRVVGMYFFDYKFISELEKTPASQYSLEVTLDRIAKVGKLSAIEINRDLTTLKYPWDLFELKDRFLSNLKFDVDDSAEIAKTAILRGDVHVCKNAKIYDYSIIEGPVYIGEGAVVGAFSQVRSGSVLEKNSKIQRYVDIKNSILGENSSIHSGFVGDSIIGKNVKIGAGFTVANKRIDREDIKVIVKGEKVNTNRKNLGILIGDNSSVGINVSSMPGSILGSENLVYPKETIKGTK